LRLRYELQMKNEQEIILIAAMSENRVIGKDNTMPWSIKGNLAHFKEMTMGWPCVMGRRTWESLPKKPLPGRLNIIISKTMDSKILTQRHEDTEMNKRSKDNNISSSAPPREILIFSSLTSAIDYCADYEKIFICGGESIYRQALPLANRIDLTLIHGQYEGDTFFPDIDETCWIKTNTAGFDEYSIISYIKNKTTKEQL